MRLSRRELLKLAAVMMTVPPRLVLAKEPLQILILGGTGFLGPHQVRAALSRGHKVTIFNRGKSDPGLFPDVEQLIGDREQGDLSALRGRRWNAVIDNCRDAPRWVSDSTQLLQEATEHYLYVSSISAYADTSVIGIKETAALNVLPSQPDAAKDPHNYGGAKAECERLVREAFPNRFTIPRPGLLVGPGDTTDRFTYWPLRFLSGGEVLCPGAPSDPTQWLDARDAAVWMVNALEQRHFGIYNLAGPHPALSMGDFLKTVQMTVRPNATQTWVPADFLDQHEVRAWMDMPCWVPPTNSGFTSIDISKALAAGLAFRPVSETVAETLTWYVTKKSVEPLKAGLSRERELEVLEAWKSR